MTKRATISKRLRFEVFKRDSFKCQYCGSSAPDAILHIDHVHPVSKGGDNDITNLVTACASCNNGKSDKLLSDKHATEMQMKQLQELSERREQLEMLMQWRAEIVDIEDKYLDFFIDEVNKKIFPASVNDNGLASARKWLKKFSIDELINALDISSDKGDDPGVIFENIPKIAAMKRMPDHEQRLRYCRGILKNRLSYVNMNAALQLLSQAYAADGDVDHLQDICKTVKNWTQFKSEIDAIINNAGANHG